MNTLISLKTMYLWRCSFTLWKQEKCKRRNRSSLGNMRRRTKRKKTRCRETTELNSSSELLRSTKLGVVPENSTNISLSSIMFPQYSPLKTQRKLKWKGKLDVCKSNRYYELIFTLRTIYDWFTSTICYCSLLSVVTSPLPKVVTI